MISFFKVNKTTYLLKTTIDFFLSVSRTKIRFERIQKLALIEIGFDKKRQTC